MERLPKAQVSAGIIFHDGKILIGQRNYGGNAGLWEFPGGKAEPGETAADCLIRECIEEIGVKITITEEFTRSFYAYPDRDIDFIFFIASLDDISGMIHPVHTDLRWITVSELDDYRFCPADDAILKQLKEKYR